jgi:hypothetical protein
MANPNQSKTPNPNQNQNQNKPSTGQKPSGTTGPAQSGGKGAEERKSGQNISSGKTGK